MIKKKVLEKHDANNVMHVIVKRERAEKIIEEVERTGEDRKNWK